MRVAVIGIGAMGRNHTRVYRDLPGAELVAVCDTSAEAAAEVGFRNSARAYTDHQEMLGKEQPDAVTVAVPTAHHRGIVVDALRAGCHVLVEKPIAPSLEEADEMIATAAGTGRLLMVGHIERYNPAVQELKRRLADGQLGRVFQLHARRLGPFPDRVRDVGVVVDLATHDLDVMRYLSGSGVSRVYAETRRQVHTSNEDLMTGLIRFENDTVGLLEINWLTPTKIRELTVLGEGGMLHVDYLTQELTQYKNARARVGARELEGVSEGEVIQHQVAKGEPLKVELESFVRAVRGDAMLEVDGEDGLRALHLAQALVMSAQEGRSLDQKELSALWRASTGHSD